MCSLARSLEVIGERWTLLILRDVFTGIRRFDELVHSLGIARTVLTRRLDALVADGVLERRAYQARPVRYEFVPTAKGQELVDVVALLMRWGDTHYPHPAGPPRQLLHHDCGGHAVPHLACSDCGQELDLNNIEARLNPALA
ncbi:winged helix-turn-helix transcriptional regulator [Pengzhenrongella phosphoraccumulans]|uniref:winged helix-turn-helix transcriptional regulator n=1 Tax=Pengzhenrongella phosphoraccumulans TaxID=3114394 RepID=UPI00388EE5C5